MVLLNFRRSAECNTLNKSFCYRIAPADVPVRVAQGVVAVRAGHPAIRNAVAQAARASVVKGKSVDAGGRRNKIKDYAN